MFNETQPIRIYDRDQVAAANAGAVSGPGESNSKGSSQELGTTQVQVPRTLEQSSADLMEQFEAENKQEAARKELESSMLQVTKDTKIVVPAPAEKTRVTGVSSLELDELKGQINDSLAELANIALEHQRMIEQINERMANFNQRSGQKL